MNSSKVIDGINGKIPFDVVIKNVQYVNIFTKEIYASEIGIIDGRIGHVNQPGEKPLEGKEIYEGNGKYAIPGLLDTHVHIESSMMTPANMAKAILIHGTTTIACDPHEIGNVVGVDGVKYMIEASEGIPLMVYILAPSCVPSVLGVETAGASFDEEEIEEIMKLDRVIGLGEVMDYQGVINQSDRMVRIINTAKKYTGFLQGHAPSLTGRTLSAYLSTGICSCHETSFREEARYKLRAGMTLECRESSIVHDIKTLAPVLKEFNYPLTTTMCTDDREPDDLLKEGHIDHVIRRAIAEGVPPIEAIKMATYNAAQLLRLSEIGSLTPGKLGNFLLLDSLEEFTVNEVFVKGELVAKAGKLVKSFDKASHPLEKRNTLILKEKPTKEFFRIKHSQEKAKIKVITFNPETPIITDLEELELPVINGYIDISERDDLALLAVFERHGVNGNRSICFVKDLGLTHGAIASTVSHDSHNLVVVGKNIEDMLIAIEELCKIGGGIVCIAEGKVESLVELPIGGLMSTETIEEMAPKTELLKRKINELGIKSTCPILQVASFALPVIPFVRLTDCGLVDVNSQSLIPMKNN